MEFVGHIIDVSMDNTAYLEYIEQLSYIAFVNVGYYFPDMGMLLANSLKGKDTYADRPDRE